MTYDEFIASEEKPDKKKKGNSKRKRSPSPQPKVYFTCLIDET